MGENFCLFWKDKVEDCSLEAKKELYRIGVCKKEKES